LARYSNVSHIKQEFHLLLYASAQSLWVSASECLYNVTSWLSSIFDL
jgi:hypothetical protein